MLSSKQTHRFDNFICYHLESGWHVTRTNHGLSLGTRLYFYFLSTINKDPRHELALFLMRSR